MPGNGTVDPGRLALAGCRDAAETCAIPRRRSYPRGRRRNKYCNETNSYPFCSVQAGGGSSGGKDIAADAEVGRVESYVDAGAREREDHGKAQRANYCRAWRLLAGGTYPRHTCAV